MNDLVANPPIAYAPPASSLSAADAADLARLRAEERARKDAQIADLNARLARVEAFVDETLEAEAAAAEADAGGKAKVKPGAGTGANGNKPAVANAAPAPAPRTNRWI